MFLKTKYEDPRNPLEKLRRTELVLLAHEHGFEEVSEEWPATSIRDFLRGKGITPTSAPNRTPGEHGTNVITMPEKPVAEMGFRELRSECKKRGIKIARTDKIEVLKEKLATQNAA